MRNKEIITKHFKEILNKISSSDRTQAAIEFKVHPITVNRYINGQIGKEDFAVDLLVFLNKKIEARENKLANL